MKWRYAAKGALGHWRTFAAQEDMSALSPIAAAKAGSCKKSCLLRP